MVNRKRSNVFSAHGSRMYATEGGRSPRDLARDVGPCIYAMRVDDGVIKIGYSENIYERITRLGRLSDVLAIVPGTFEQEQAIHQSLVTHRAHRREYYHPVPDVLAAVNQMRETVGMDPIGE